MISEKLQKAINEQITAEMWSSNLYLAMSFYFEKEGFSGFAHWMKKQSQEEMGHAYAMADYIIKRGGTAIVDKIDVVPNGWGTPLEVFEHVYKHECHVSALVDKLVDVASIAEKEERGLFSTIKARDTAITYMADIMRSERASCRERV